jgi:putative transferase (TIGR04331 family)
MIKRSRIFIATYNSTTYLETLAWNIPTIAFWNPDNWDLRENVRDDFELLKKVKILHDTPESAAEHLTDIWNDIPKWWNSKEVQEAVLKFCNQWSYTGQDVLSNIETCLRKDN